MCLRQVYAGIGDCFRPNLSPDTGCPIARQTPQISKRGSKRTIGRKRGGQAGKARGSASHVRRDRRKSDEWTQSMPETDYGAIVDQLRELKRQKAAGGRSRVAKSEQGNHTLACDLARTMLTLIGREFPMSQSSAFMTAFWAGLASPTGLFAATPVYVPQILGYRIANSFAQVGMSLTQVSVPAYHGGEPDRPERSAA